MSMKNLDQQKQPIADFVSALQGDDPARVQTALEGVAEGIAQRVLGEARALAGERDARVLAQRGVRQLTSAETAYYQAVMEAMRSNNPQQALTNVDATLPQTVLEAVLEDIRAQSPLLAALKVQNVTAVTRWILNKQGAQLAAWGPLGGKITQELAGSFTVFDVTACKLSAAMPIPMDFLDLGPAWMDRYARAVLTEAAVEALEQAVVTGTGKDQPIGMDRDVSDDVSVSGGVYPQKTKVTLASFESKDYLPVVGRLAKSGTGRQRAVNSVALLVNPEDYFSVVRPATTILTSAGTYAGDVFPFPTTVYQTAYVAKGSAILGLLPRYFLGLGTPAARFIDYDDSVQFLDDARAYRARLRGNGRPMDDNAFVFLDISSVSAERVIPVRVKGTVSTKAEGGETA